MMSFIAKIWNFISYLGVSESDIHNKREVILLNKSAFIALLLVILFIPFEIILNGFTLVPFEISAALIFTVVLYFNSKQWHTTAKYYTIFVGTILILFSTYAVGGHSNSEFNLLPIMLFPLLFFRKNIHIILLTSCVAISFFVLKFTVDSVPPFIDIPLEVRLKVQPIMNVMTMVFLFVELFYFKKLNLSFENQLNLQKEQIQQKHAEIKASINYAKRIQQAILPNVTEIKKSLPQSFVYYQPKDVVAGDFYWFEQYKNNLYLAAADCTGHGVPGAMVSVICSNALNKALLEEGIEEVDKLLNRTRDLVVERLAKGDKNVKDGMDISLLKMNPTTRQVEWAGANNPLYILCKNQFVLTKADRQPIGITENPQPFTKHRFDLQTGDQIYLFTDGYADQFGGNEDKKLGYKAFREKILEISNLDLETQKEKLSSYFEQWKGAEEQVDDVCIIGIRI